MLWWILGSILFLILLLLLLRIGVLLSCQNGSFLVRVSAGPVKIQVYPRKNEKKPDGENQKPHREKGEKRVVPKPSFSDIRWGFRELWPSLKKALNRTRRGIRIDPLDLSILFAGREDPAAVAELYGFANAGVWTVMPALERLIEIPHPAIHLDMDFDADTHQLSGQAGVSARVGTLLAIGLQIGIPALRWFSAYQKKKQQETDEKTAEAAGIEPSAAA